MLYTSCQYRHLVSFDAKEGRADTLNDQASKAVTDENEGAVTAFLCVGVSSCCSE